MFHSKVFSVLQSIVNRNLCNIRHINSFQYALFSTDPVSGNLAEASEKALNVSPKNTNENSHQPNTSAIPACEISVEASVGTSLSNTSSTEYEPDKLYKKLEVEVRGNDRAVLKSYGEFACEAAKHLEINIGRNIAAPRPIHNRLTVLRSVHVHKKHRVQYEMRTYYRYLDFFNLTGSTADTFLEYIQRNLPEGVAMKVTKVELQSLPESVQQATALQ